MGEGRGGIQMILNNIIKYLKTNITTMDNFLIFFFSFLFTSFLHNKEIYFIDFTFHKLKLASTLKNRISLSSIQNYSNFEILKKISFAMENRFI